MRGDLIMHFMSLGFHELMINGTLQFCLSQPRNRNSSLINQDPTLSPIRICAYRSTAGEQKKLMSHHQRR